MINNRQPGRRNRGRNNNGSNNNNGRPTGGNRGGGDSGNRIDNRARGNAAQLLEKYKNMARDAQMAGDRVNAEYYLQFADHYFRVLADNRTRQEEQQQRFRRPDESFDDEAGDFDGNDDNGDDMRVEQAERADRDNGRRNSEPRGDQRDQRNEQQDGRDRNRRDRNRRDRPVSEEGADQRPAAVEAEPSSQPVETVHAEAEAPKPRRGRPRKADVVQEDVNEGLDITILPPSIARADNDSEAAEEAPRKRTRRTRPATEAAE